MDARNHAAGIGRILLIDLDNCPHELLQLVETVDRYQMVVACHGGKEPRVPLNLVASLGDLISSGRVEVVAMPPGKNAADFGLTFWAGRLSAQVDSTCEFHIASRDKDLDFAVKSLRDAGYQARRISGAAEIAAAEVPPDATSLSSAHRVKKLCEMLLRMRKNLPRRKTSLRNFVTDRSRGKEDFVPALEILEQTGVITYGPFNTVEYDKSGLRQLAEAREAELPPAREKLVIPPAPPLSRRITSGPATAEPKADRVTDREKAHRQLRLPFQDTDPA